MCHLSAGGFREPDSRETEYLDLVIARGKDESAQGLRTLAPVFRPETPLDRFERWLDELPAPNEALEFLAAATLSRLLTGGAVPTSLASKQVAQLAVAGCIQACAADSVDASGLSLTATVDLLAADLDDPRWFQAVRERLRAFPRDEVTARLIERLPVVGNTYGAIQIARAMGELAWDEFVPCLIDGLRRDQPDFLSEAADSALVQIGAAARDALIAQWNGLDSSQHIYGLSVIRNVGGLPAADFAIEHADELLDSELESFCELALAVPDTRLLERLCPELRRKQVLIDRAFAILARLLGHEDAAAEEARHRALADYERTRLQRERFTLGDFHRDKLSLSLRCPACGSTNVYDVRSVIMPGQDHGDLPYLVADEFPCASCGAYTEF